ncbi:MAG TPA: cytochrome c oxidase assembly protein [Solirubrobacteraceae bacterium]|nr:cytochrome c oxidase assembly protein [Solirubrobacteraceae bacterium]
MLSSLVADFPLLLVAVALVLHVAGERRVAAIRRRPRDRRARWRAVSFYAGLATIVVALAGPIDTYAAKLFWVHMVQHVLLLTVAAPLIALGAPWMSMWRPLPLGFRRGAAGAVARDQWAAPLRAIGRWLGRPLGTWLAFNVNLILWHIPVMYDLTLRHLAVHALEHTTFLLFGVLLWCQVIDSPPVRARLRTDMRVYYMLASGIVSWVLSLVLAFAPSPLYPVYAHIAARPGGISALADQQIAGGVMLGPGSVSITLFVFIGLYRWLGGEGDGNDRAALRERSATRGVRT